MRGICYREKVQIREICENKLSNQLSIYQETCIMQQCVFLYLAHTDNIPVSVRCVFTVNAAISGGVTFVDNVDVLTSLPTR